MAESRNHTSPILVILCALGVLAFLLLVIYPNYRNMKEYDRRIEILNEEIALRQSLAPIYNKLIEKSRMAPLTQLIVPEKTTMELKDTGQLTRIFQDIALSADLILESVIPDSQAFAPGTGRLMVDVVFRGDFLDVQPLINTIAAQSFVDLIQGVRVQSAKEEKRITLSVSLLHG